MGAGRATYGMPGQLAINAAQAELLLAQGRLLAKPEWSAETLPPRVMAPEVPLGRIVISGEGHTVDSSQLEHLARLFNAAAACGLAEAALDEALAAGRTHADDSRQLTEFKLADMRTRVDGARMLTHKAAVWLGVGAPEATQACREARIFAAEAAVFCAEQAMAIGPGWGSIRLQGLARDCHLPAALDQSLGDERLELAQALLAG